MYDLIILGGGPAGLTATVYAIHKRIETLLITEDLGGKANYRMHIRGLEGYETINGEEMVRKFQTQVEYLDFARLMDKAVSVEALHDNGGDELFKITTESGTSFVARAVIVATGARPRMLDVPGERSLLGLGVSYSAISHAPLFWGKETAVVGNDDLAFRAVTELASLCNRVYLVAKDPLPHPSPWMDKIRSLDNVTVLENTAVTAVSGSPYLEEMTVRTPKRPRTGHPRARLVRRAGAGPELRAGARAGRAGRPGPDRCGLPRPHQPARYLCRRRCHRRLCRAGPDRHRRRRQGGSIGLRVLAAPHGADANWNNS